MPQYLTADEAADELDVTKNTLYAYVSRGLVRSEPADTSRRTRRYRADDIRRLKRRTAYAQDPATAARTALDWGLPVTESSLTLIDEGGFYYRGHDACTLAETHALEEVAPLLWDTDADRVSFTDPPDDITSLAQSVAPSASPLDRIQAALPQAAAIDDSAFDLSRHGGVDTGVQVLSLLTALAASPDNDSAVAPIAEATPIAERLRHAWAVEGDDAPSLLNAALVLCADHGLNVTAFAVRCVASAEGTPYGAVNAGLSALRGRRHTGNTARIEALLREAGSPEHLRDTVTARRRRGDPVPGFGHRLYPDGDPRAAHLIKRLQAVAPNADGTAFATAAREVGPDLLDRLPALDFALVALKHAIDLPAQAPLLLFALGRTVGWTGHLIEQYEEAQVIRPRAQYVGPPPESS